MEGFLIYLLGLIHSSFVRFANSNLFTPPEVSEELMHVMLSAWQSHCNCKLGLGPTLSIEMGQSYVRQCPSL